MRQSEIEVAITKAREKEKAELLKKREAQSISNDGDGMVVRLDWDKNEHGGNSLILNRYYNSDVVLGLHGSFVSGPKFDMKEPGWFTASGERCDSLEGAF